MQFLKALIEPGRFDEYEFKSVSCKIFGEFFGEHLIRRSGLSSGDVCLFRRYRIDIDKQSDKPQGQERSEHAVIADYVRPPTELSSKILTKVVKEIRPDGVCVFTRFDRHVLLPYMNYIEFAGGLTPGRQLVRLLLSSVDGAQYRIPASSMTRAWLVLVPFGPKAAPGVTLIVWR